MARYIDADEAYEIGRNEHKDFAMSMGDLTSLREVLDDTPTADVVEVKHGRWETIPDYSQALTSYRHICSECKIVYKDIRPYGHNYCPNCGVKMDGKDESNET